MKNSLIESSLDETIELNLFYKLKYVLLRIQITFYCMELEQLCGMSIVYFHVLKISLYRIERRMILFIYFLLFLYFKLTINNRFYVCK